MRTSLKIDMHNFASTKSDLPTSKKEEKKKGGGGNEKKKNHHQNLNTRFYIYIRRQYVINKSSSNYINEQ